MKRTKYIGDALQSQGDLDEFDQMLAEENRKASGIAQVHGGGPGSGRYPKGSGGEPWADAAPAEIHPLAAVADLHHHVTFYHGTDSAVLAKIARTGLIPQGSAGSDAWVKTHLSPEEYATLQRFNAARMPSVYMTAKPDNAQFYAEKAASMHRGSQPVVLRLEVPDKIANKMVHDEASDSAFDGRYAGKVPPQYITGVITRNDTTFQPLSKYVTAAAEPVAGTHTFYTVVVAIPEPQHSITAGGPGSGPHPGDPDPHAGHSDAEIADHLLSRGYQEKPSYGGERCFKRDLNRYADDQFDPDHGVVHYTGLEHEVYVSPDGKFVAHNGDPYPDDNVQGEDVDGMRRVADDFERKASYDSSSTNYDPSKKARWEMAALEAGGPGSGRYPKGSGGNGLGREGDAHVFVSPNEGELSYAQAKQALASPEQKEFEGETQHLSDRVFGEGHARVSPILGSWATGAENSVHVMVHSRDREKQHYVAAKMGAGHNQMASLVFRNHANGPHALYAVSSPEDSDTLNDKIAASGIEHRSVQAGPGGSKAYIFDSDGTLHDKVAALGAQNGYKIVKRQGTGEFLGSWDSREAGVAAQRAIADQFEQKYRSFGPRGRTAGKSPAGGGHGVRAGGLRERSAASIYRRTPATLQAQAALARQMKRGQFRIHASNGEVAVASDFRIAKSFAQSMATAETEVHVFNADGEIVMERGGRR